MVLFEKIISEREDDIRTVNEINKYLLKGKDYDIKVSLNRSYFYYHHYLFIYYFAIVRFK